MTCVDTIKAVRDSLQLRRESIMPFNAGAQRTIRSRLRRDGIERYELSGVVFGNDSPLFPYDDRFRLRLASNVMVCKHLLCDQLREENMGFLSYLLRRQALAPCRTSNGNSERRDGVKNKIGKEAYLPEQFHHIT